jgi:hypothetical protein
MDHIPSGEAREKGEAKKRPVPPERDWQEDEGNEGTGRFLQSFSEAENLPGSP